MTILHVTSVVRLDSIAVSLFGNMTVVTGEIHINNKVILSDSIAVSLFGNMTQLLQEKYT